MDFLPLLQLYLQIAIAFASPVRDQQEWPEYAKLSSPSSKPSIDRLLAFPGPQNDVTNGAPVAPDLKPSANIRPIYMSTVEALTRTINHPPHYKDTRASDSAPGMGYNLFGSDKTESPKTAPIRSATHTSSIPTHWLTADPENQDNEVDEMLQPMKVNVGEALHYLTPLMEIIKNTEMASSTFLRPDGSASQETRDNTEKLSSVPTRNSHEGEDARLSLLSQKIKTYDSRKDDGNSLWQVREFKKENHQEVYPTHIFKKQPVKYENRDSDLSDYLPIMPLKKNLISPAQYWSSGEREGSHLIDNISKKIFGKQDQEHTLVNKPYRYSEDMSSHPLTNKNRELLEEVNNEILHPTREFQSQSLENSHTSINSTHNTEKDPFIIGMEIEDQIKNKRAKQETLIFPDFKDKADQVLIEISKLKEILHGIFEILHSNNKKNLYGPGKEIKSINMGLPKEEWKIKSKRNRIPFQQNHTFQFTGIKQPQLTQLISSKKEKNMKWPRDTYEKSHILESVLPFTINIPKYDGDKKVISMPEKFSSIDMLKFWQPDMETTSPSTAYFSTMPLNVPLHYLKDMIKLLDDLERVKSKINNDNKHFPLSTKDSRIVKMTIKQDYLNLPAGSEEIMQGGAGMTPGKQEGGGFRVKINVPHHFTEDYN